MKAPTLMLDGKIFEMDQSADTADTILKFGDERRKLSVDNFIARHIEILAQVFNAPTEQIKNLGFTLIVRKYLDCLEFVAREFSEIDLDLDRKNKRRRRKR